MTHNSARPPVVWTRFGQRVKSAAQFAFVNGLTAGVAAVAARAASGESMLTRTAEALAVGAPLGAVVCMATTEVGERAGLSSRTARIIGASATILAGVGGSMALAESGAIDQLQADVGAVSIAYGAGSMMRPLAETAMDREQAVDIEDEVTDELPYRDYRRDYDV